MELPLGFLEDWYVLYQVMPDRRVKADLVERALLARSRVDRSRFVLAAANGLPAAVRGRLQRLFGPLPCG